MINIVLPIAGRGSRFSEAGFELPKPLIPVHGKPMIEVVVNNIRPLCEHRFIFVALKEHLDHLGMTETLNRIAPGCIIIPVTEVTEGAACTVLLARKFIDNNDIKIFKNKTQLSNDIGTLTVMNLMDYPNFKYDDLQMDWYEDNNITYKNKTMINKLSNGYSILSGYGDGTYPLSIGKHKNKIVKIIIDFEI